MTWLTVVELDSLLIPYIGERKTVTPVREASVVINFEGTYAAVPMRWGFSRRSADKPGNRPDHIHARAETVDTLPTFADAFSHRRGLLIVSTFNEGEEAGKKTVQYTITPIDGRPLAIAVIWEKWERDSGTELYTFVMLTTPPNELIGVITDRMPAIIKPEDWAKWLAPDTCIDELKAMLVTRTGEWEMERENKERQESLF